MNARMDGLTAALDRLGPPGPIAFVLAGLALSAVTPLPPAGSSDTSRWTISRARSGRRRG
jgi:hypothetical protein